MAISYNLLSCDDITYPSVINRHNILLTPILGETVEFDTIPNKYYTIERNNQAFFPYPNISGDGAYVLMTITSFKYNNDELVTSPIVVNSSTEAKTNITGGASNPPIFPTDYISSWLKDANYISGTTYGIGFTNAIQNIIDSSSINTVFVRRTNKQPKTSDGTSVSFSNFCIHKRENDSVKIEYTLEYHPSVGSVTTNNIAIDFTGASSSYKVDNTETSISGFLSQEYVTINSPLRLFDFQFTSYDEVDCPCEACEKCFLLTNCSDKTVWFKTYTDLTDSVGQVVELEDIGGCWTVEECPKKIEIVVKDTFVHCKSCQPKCYTPKCN